MTAFLYQRSITCSILVHLVARLGLPRAYSAGVSVYDNELVGPGLLPWTDFAVRPLDADLHGSRRSQAKMRPAKLATRVTAADGQLAAQCFRGDLDLDPGSDCVAVRARLAETNSEPIAS